ncbi:putative endonuclease [Sedimentibacter acidaminivorans]|jgi:putative endonuclease|uniref:Endonuclease n=1 Tax=Sedimentibacter acidaminivorans TaxID=913099 RepID=A0ABS4GI09_9FIRM|nr:GIY-YIG nuclease family protein [Sedimentibacter acidaminivorans]MBP1927000.1 putative endonuclease [Sedimentibacter acidaminivorans]
MYYIYIAECGDGTLYTGFTVDLEKRIKVHNKGKGAKYTRGRTPLVLKYYEEFDSKNDALRRESEIKKLKKIKKIELIEKFKV